MQAKYNPHGLARVSERKSRLHFLRRQERRIEQMTRRQIRDEALQFTARVRV